jgi:hypothetical protein
MVYKEYTILKFIIQGVQSGEVIFPALGGRGGKGERSERIKKQLFPLSKRRGAQG